MKNRQTRPGAGPSSKITDEQILDAARRFFEDGKTQSSLARSLSVSASYLARLLKLGRKRGLFSVHVVPQDGEQVIATRSSLPARGQLALTVDGTRACVVVDLQTATTQSQEIKIGGTVLTVTVTRS